MKNMRLQGFTLVEMSIVLVIIGTLLGGILMGKSLLDSSRLQTVMTDADSYATAVVNFKQTYQALPGDFNNAETLWGTDNIGCPAGGGTSGTCNGDGGGTISNPVGSATKAAETFLFWQHLNKAGMFSQNLKNEAGAGGDNDSFPGINVPAGSIKGSGFSVFWRGTVDNTDVNYFPGFYGHILMFGSSHDTSQGYLDTDMTRDAVLTPDQASQIDIKMDDGLPAYGKVRAFQHDSTITSGCSTKNNPTTAAYNMTYLGVMSNGVRCSLIFVMGF